MQPKRYQADISAEAAAKRGQVQAKAEAKAAEDQQRKVAQKAGEERLGHMMDGKSRMMKEVDEADTVPDEDAMDSEYVPDDLQVNESDDESSEYEEVVVIRKKVSTYLTVSGSRVCNLRPQTEAQRQRKEESACPKLPSSCRRQSTRTRDPTHCR